jgi:hypothetical protein
MLVKVFHYVFVEVEERGLTSNIFFLKMGTEQAYGIILSGRGALHVFCCFLCFDYGIGGWVFFFFCIDAKP